MGFAEDMTNMGEHFISSFDNRIKDVKKIMANTHQMRREFRKDNNNLFEYTHGLLKNARKFVKGAHEDHKNMARKQKNDLSKFAKDLSANTSAQLRGFSKEHREMARKQRQFLASNNKKMSDECHEFLDACCKQQQKVHNEFKHAHQNFQRAMNELERHRKSVHFPAYGEHAEPGSAKKAKPGKASPKRRAPTKKHSKRRVSR